MDKLTKGTEIYYAGDMMNEPKFGIIAAVIEDRWGTSLEVVYDDGTSSRLSPCQFSEKYLGHCGTRYVTKAAYDDWKSEQVAMLMAHRTVA